MIRTGSNKVTEDILRRRIEEDSSGITVTRFYHGPADDVLAARPTIGAVWKDMPGEPAVERNSLAYPAPNTAELTTTGRKEYSGGTGTAEDDQPVYEVEWGQLEKPLLANPRYSTKDIFGITAGDTLTDEGLTVAGAVETWRNASTLAEKKDIRQQLFDKWTKAADMFDDIIKKLGEGKESYIMPAPVLRITTRSTIKPTTTQVGKIGPPTGFPGIPKGYTWLATADRAIRQGRGGKWERVREWTGADAWDKELYPDA